jgi:hypothetical protein
MGAWNHTDTRPPSPLMMASAVARRRVMKWISQELSARISCSIAAHIQVKLVAAVRPPRPAPSSGNPSELSGGWNRPRSDLAVAKMACTALVTEAGST